MPLAMLLSALFLGVPARAAAALQKASGGGLFQASGNEFMLAFGARQLDEMGNAKGQFEYHNRTSGSMLHMQIFYLVVDGDEAWLGGIVTKAFNVNAQIGDERIVKVRDNGRGANAVPDECSKLSNQAASSVLEKPNLMLFPLDNGSIRIR